MLKIRLKSFLGCCILHYFTLCSFDYSGFSRHLDTHESCVKDNGSCHCLAPQGLFNPQLNNNTTPKATSDTEETSQATKLEKDAIQTKMLQEKKKLQEENETSSIPTLFLEMNLFLEVWNTKISHFDPQKEAYFHNILFQIKDAYPLVLNLRKKINTAIDHAFSEPSKFENEEDIRNTVQSITASLIEIKKSFFISMTESLEMIEENLNKTHQARKVESGKREEAVLAFQQWQTANTTDTKTTFEATHKEFKEAIELTNEQQNGLILLDKLSEKELFNNFIERQSRKLELEILLSFTTTSVNNATTNYLEALEKEKILFVAERKQSIAKQQKYTWERSHPLDSQETKNSEEKQQLEISLKSETDKLSQAREEYKKIAVESLNNGIKKMQSLQNNSLHYMKLKIDLLQHEIFELLRDRDSTPNLSNAMIVTRVTNTKNSLRAGTNLKRYTQLLNILLMYKGILEEERGNTEGQNNKQETQKQRETLEQVGVLHTPTEIFAEASDDSPATEKTPSATTNTTTQDNDLSTKLFSEMSALHTQLSNATTEEEKKGIQKEINTKHSRLLSVTNSNLTEERDRPTERANSENTENQTKEIAELLHQIDQLRKQTQDTKTKKQKDNLLDRLDKLLLEQSASEKDKQAERNKTTETTNKDPLEEQRTHLLSQIETINNKLNTTENKKLKLELEQQRDTLNRRVSNLLTKDTGKQPDNQQQEQKQQRGELKQLDLQLKQLLEQIELKQIEKQQQREQLELKELKQLEQLEQLELKELDLKQQRDLKLLAQQRQLEKLEKMSPELKQQGEIQLAQERERLEQRQIEGKRELEEREEQQERERLEQRDIEHKLKVQQLEQIEKQRQIEKQIEKQQQLEQIEQQLLEQIELLEQQRLELLELKQEQEQKQREQQHIEKQQQLEKQQRLQREQLDLKQQKQRDLKRELKQRQLEEQKQRLDLKQQQLEEQKEGLERELEELKQRDLKQGELEELKQRDLKQYLEKQYLNLKQYLEKRYLNLKQEQELEHIEQQQRELEEQKEGLERELKRELKQRIEREQQHRQEQEEQAGLKQRIERELKLELKQQHRQDPEAKLEELKQQREQQHRQEQEAELEELKQQREELKQKRELKQQREELKQKRELKQREEAEEVAQEGQEGQEEAEEVQSDLKAKLLGNDKDNIYQDILKFKRDVMNIKPFSPETPTTKTHGVEPKIITVGQLSMHIVNMDQLYKEVYAEKSYHSPKNIFRKYFRKRRIKYEQRKGFSQRKDVLLKKLNAIDTIIQTIAHIKNQPPSDKKESWFSKKYNGIKKNLNEKKKNKLFKQLLSLRDKTLKNFTKTLRLVDGYKDVTEQSIFNKLDEHTDLTAFA